MYEPKTTIVDMTVANTEYSWDIPESVVAFSIKMRTAAAWELNLGGAAGDIASGTKLSMTATQVYSRSDLKTIAGTKAFFRCPSSVNVAEIEYWL